MSKFVLLCKSDGMFFRDFKATCGFGEQGLLYNFTAFISDAFHFEDEEQADLIRNFLIVCCDAFRSDLLMRRVTKVVPVKKSQQPPKEV